MGRQKIGSISRLVYPHWIKRHTFCICSIEEIKQWITVYFNCNCSHWWVKWSSWKPNWLDELLKPWEFIKTWQGVKEPVTDCDITDFDTKDGTLHHYVVDCRFATYAIESTKCVKICLPLIVLFLLAGYLSLRREGWLWCWTYCLAILLIS